MGALLHVLGLDDASGVPYLAWSGFGGDLGIVGALAALTWSFWRRHNCEVRGCWRIGRHQTAGGHHVCRCHHPDGEPSAEHVAWHHLARRERPP